MTSTAELRKLWAPWKCDTSKMVRHEFPGDGKVWRLLVADVSIPAWDAFTLVMKHHDYLFLEAAGGTYNCRNIASSGLPSLHSYGIAIDINPSKNPFGTHKNNFPSNFLLDIASITINGRPAFTWGGTFTIPDPMHFQLNVGPAAFTQPPDPGDDMPTIEEIRKMVREELDRRGDGRPGAINRTVGIAENIAGYPLPPEGQERTEPSNRQLALRTKGDTSLILGEIVDDDPTSLIESIRQLPDNTVAAIRDALNKGTLQ